MKKIIQLLEDYVQWAVLALGVLWVAYIVMTYVINVPSRTFPPDRTELTVGTIDEYIYNHQQQDLENAMSSPAPVDWPPIAPVTVASVLPVRSVAPVPFMYMPAPTQDAVTTGGVAVAGQPNQQKGIVTDVPKIPPVALAAPKFGRSQLDIPGLPKPDVDWVVISGSIPVASMVQEWNRVYGKTQLTVLNTYFLQAVLVRSEKLPNGDWGNEKINPMLSGQGPAVALPAYPADGNVQAQHDYVTQIQNQNVAITNPPAYKVIAGDLWPAPAAGIPAPAPQPAPGAPPAGAPPAGAAQGALPPGIFVPNANSSDIPICLHDESAEPLKTYRYKIVYRLYNPAFGLNANLADPKIAGQLALVSPDSAWSAPVPIPARTYAFIKSLKSVSKDLVSADFDVITWTNGVIRLHSCQVNVGDEIRDGDYISGLTLIDANVTSGSVLIANDRDGTVTFRDIPSDAKDPQYQSLKTKAAASAAAGSGAN